MTQPTNVPSRPHLEFLDGLRGCAAIYVACSHIVGESTVGTTGVEGFIFHWLLYGRIAVAMFIVLSGYCLMLPVVSGGGDSIPGGNIAYFKRRARRILPPYYAALAFTFLISVVSTTGLHMLAGQAGNGQRATALRDMLSAGDIVSHLMLIHNWSPHFNMLFDGPTWSVASEWQIYFLFPFLLLPARRCFGRYGPIVIGFGLGIGMCFLPYRYSLYWACPWYIGLFALGMLGAQITFGTGEAEIRLRDKASWGVLAVLSWAVTAGLWMWDGKVLINRFGYLLDGVAGFASLSTILYCAHVRQSSGARGSGVLNVLQSKPAVTLGAFSYSLYLLHQPFSLKLGPLMMHIPHPFRIPFLVFVGMPTIVGCCWVFYLIFERPFTRSKASNRSTGR